MKMILASVALAFLAVGCAADQNSENGQDPSELETSKAPTAEPTEMPSIEAESASTVYTNCVLFCDADFKDCLASGLGLQVCRAEQRDCIVNLCHR